MDAYLSITCHFIDNGERKTVILSCTEFNERHTAVNTSDKLTSLLQGWDISDKIVCVLRDNASAQLKALQIANLPHEGCFAHSLNLIVKETLLGSHVYQDIVKAARNIVKYFHHSVNASEILIQKQREQNVLQPLKLIVDVSTRWNSTYEMLNRLLHLKAVLPEAMEDASCPHPQLTSGDWALLLDVCSFATVQACN